MSGGRRELEPGWAGSGFRVYGGAGPTTADLDDLDAMTRTLRAAAGRLDDAAATLRRAAWLCADGRWGEPAAAVAALHAVTAASEGPHGPAACADEVRDLATRVGHAVRWYDGAESLVERLARRGVDAEAGLLGDFPVLVPVAALGGVVAVGSAAQLLTVTSPLRRLRHDGDDPTLDRLRRFFHPDAALPDRLAADGRGTWEVSAAAAFLHAALTPGLQAPMLVNPVPATAAELARRLRDAPPTAVVPVDDPPYLPAPRTTADVLANVEATHTEGSGGVPGTPTGAIVVQRLDHPDGTVGWVVAVPGTQAWSPNAATPTDLTTNLQEVGGVADDMTTATVEAMRLAGMRAGDQVLIAGHSQGGMTATSVAAAVAGYYDVRAVLTAGSPDVPARLPAGVQVRAYRHTEDVVPQLDGEPDVGSPRVAVVTRELRSTGGPANPTVAQAHSLDEYVRTAERADAELAGSPAMRGYDEAQAQVLGPDGTTPTTMQFQATRDPVLARYDPVTGLPRAPRIEPMYPAAR